MSMKPFGFPRQRRLLRAKEFTSLVKLGRRSFTGHFIVYLLPNKLQFSRLGVSINRHTGNAVERNRLKRKLREYFRLNQSAVQRPIDIHIAVKRGVKAKNAATVNIVEDELGELLAKTESYALVGEKK